MALGKVISGATWLRASGVRTLNVAGASERTAPGVGAAAGRLLDAVFDSSGQRGSTWLALLAAALLVALSAAAAIALNVRLPESASCDSPSSRVPTAPSELRADLGGQSSYAGRRMEHEEERP